LGNLPTDLEFKKVVAKKGQEEKNQNKGKKSILFAKTPLKKQENHRGGGVKNGTRNGRRNFARTTPCNISSMKKGPLDSFHGS